MLNLNHKKLDVWKDSIQFVKEIYKVTANFPKSEIFGISNQLRRASVSIASNISEGASRKTVNERKRLFEISRSSLVEIDTQLIISFELNYLNQSELNSISKTLNTLFARLSNLILKTR